VTDETPRLAAWRKGALAHPGRVTLVPQPPDRLAGQPDQPRPMPHDDHPRQWLRRVRCLFGIERAHPRDEGRRVTTPIRMVDPDEFPATAHVVNLAAVGRAGVVWLRQIGLQSNAQAFSACEARRRWGHAPTDQQGQPTPLRRPDRSRYCRSSADPAAAPWGPAPVTKLGPRPGAQQRRRSRLWGPACEVAKRSGGGVSRGAAAALGLVFRRRVVAATPEPMRHAVGSTPRQRPFAHRTPAQAPRPA